jgi:CDGSH-type Zn-finger protein/uncharacterized Fe-S cluster protein YjdI
MSDDAEEYRGQGITVRFDGKKCIHSRNCVLARPDVFRPNVEGEWIKPDAVAAEEVAAIARACPSGALTYQRQDGVPDEAPPPVNVVRVRENGPLALHGDLAIQGQEPMIRATLCRCGASRNKPFCDGTHATVEKHFIATGEPPLEDSEPLGEGAGQLTIKPLRNGPFIVLGNLEICTGTGHTVTRVNATRLCRCGASRRKPFCDGKHAEIGFTTE